MACGDIAWWRAPDFAGLLQRHGQIEHLIIQFDFLVQLRRNPRAEFSIPRASKGEPGKTGYADIVAIASKEIWEIKPKHLEVTAAKEARHYVKFAKIGCSPDWLAGKTFQVSDWAKDRYSAENIVYRAEARKMRYELVCEQGTAGAVIYHWRVNGREQGALDNALGWAVRGKVIADYFGSQVPPPLKDARAPNNFPPVKFKPPVLTPDACIPILQPCLAALQKTMVTTCAQHIMEGGGIAVLLEEAAFNAIYGRVNVTRTIERLRVQGNPQVTFARALYVALNVGGATFGIPYAVWMLWELGDAVVATFEATGASATAAAPAAGSGAGGPLGAELMGMFTTAMRSLAVRTVVTAGATIMVVAVPRVSQATPGKPVAVDLFPIKFHPIKPREMALARTGQTYNLQGADHYIVGLASPFLG